MTTTVRMLGWSAEGLRCPDYSISFEKEYGKIHPVTLIQMPNGTGKTTTLQLLRAALSGRAEYENWGPEKVRSFRKKNGFRNRGEFQVVILLNNHRVTFTLNFDFEEGTVKTYTTSGNGKETGFRPPREGKDFLNPDFIEFLVFDGELAHKLLDSTHTNAEKSIEFLYKVSHFNSIKRVIEEHWSNVVTNSTASDPRAQTRRENVVNSLKKRIAELRIEKENKENELNDLKKEYEIITNKYEDKIHEKVQFDNEYEEKKMFYEAAIGDVNTLTKKIIKDIRSPHLLSSVFGKEVIDLKCNLDKAKLPESTAKEFFQDLAKEEYCVCGRKLDEEHKNKLIDRSSHYMGSDEMNFLNIIKSEIANQISEDPEYYELGFKEDIRNYRKSIQEKYKTKTDLTIIEEALAGGDSTIQVARKKKEELESKIANLEEDLKKYISKDDTLDIDKTFGIDILDVKLFEAEKKLSEITKTVELKKKTDILNQIIIKAHVVAMQRIIESIREDANQRIRELLPHNSIEIANIDKALKLRGQEAGSVGETLSVAYAFMATLFSSTERELPFIVDSPANSLDNKVREEVANLIPNLTKQFIAFTISSERGSFVNPLDQASQGDVNYLTIFRQGDKNLEKVAKTSGGETFTTDGIIVNGKDFFFKFHKNDEEELGGN